MAKLLCWMLQTILLISTSWLGWVSADEAGNTSAQNADESPRPPFALSLKGLYHPQEKHEYLQPLPKTHWLGQQQSKLLIREGDRWRQMVLDSENKPTNQRSEWPVFQKLCDQLGQLDGMDPKKIHKLVADAVPQMKDPSDSVLIDVNQALVVVSQNMPARYISRDASSWLDTTLDPAGRRLGYTIDGEMYVLEIASNQTRRLTHDGSPTLLDGRLDWTYQEEIFGRGNYRAFWFSRDSNWLAMMRVDTTNVPTTSLPNSKSPRGEATVQRYSKAGDPIPQATLMMWDLRNFCDEGVPPAQVIEASTTKDEKIFMGVWWHPGQPSLYYCVSDRQQSYREIRVVHVSDWLEATKIPHAAVNAHGHSPGNVLFREQSPAWIEPPAAPTLLADGGLVWRSELPSGHHQLYRIGPKGRSVYPLTPEPFAVEDFAVSQDMKTVVFTGRPTDMADIPGGMIGTQSVYRIEPATDKSARTHSVLRLTAQQGWHDVRMSPDQKWLLDHSSTIHQPPELALIHNDGQHSVRTVIASHELKVDSEIGVPEFLSIPTDDGVALPAMLVRPRDRTKKKVPVVVEVYGGPGLAVVKDRWNTQRILYRELLARQGIATLVVDNRSSGSDDASLRWSIRGHFGQVEHADLMTAVAWLKRQAWVDGDRLAIRGWSFGGFMTLYALTHSNSFLAGIAGGSVTDWTQYDSFYTERYMGHPANNQQGYAESSLISAAKKMSGHLLLIHGEADDNVHAAQSLRMASALQDAGKDFRLMIYPGAGHGITDSKQKWHLQQMTHRFLLENLLD